MGYFKDVHKWRILIADDDPDTVELLKWRFEHAGFFVATAQNGKEAVERFADFAERHQPVEFCVLDYDMPFMRGDIAAIQIREIAKTFEVEEPDIIMFTGSSDPLLLTRLQSSNIGIPLIKPFGLDTLERIITRLTGQPVLSRIVSV